MEHLPLMAFAFALVVPFAAIALAPLLLIARRTTTGDRGTRAIRVSATLTAIGYGIWIVQIFHDIYAPLFAGTYDHTNGLKFVIGPAYYAAHGALPVLGVAGVLFLVSRRMRFQGDK